MWQGRDVCRTVWQAGRVIEAVSSEQHHTDSVRVTRWDIAPGAHTGPHRHDFDYLVVPLVDARMTLTFPDGTHTVAELHPGQSYLRAAGVQHDVSNEGPDHVAFVEIELLDRPG